MEIITKVLIEAFDSNVSYSFLMSLIILSLHFFNIVLGTILGSMQTAFNLKKFLFGIFKALCLFVIVIGLCYVVNVFVLTINLIDGIEFDRSIINVLQVLAILITTAREILAECLEKLRSFKDLKLTEADVVISDTDVNEPIDFKG